LGAWDDPRCIDPAWGPGGIWAPVHLVTSGPVRISSLRLTCSSASPERAVVELSVSLDAAAAEMVVLGTEASSCAGGLAARLTRRQPLAAGTNRVSWRLEVPRPQLWWPAGAGEQPLYDVSVSVEAEGGASDSRTLRTGLRQVRMRGYRWAVNGEGVFLKGANLVPTRRDLAAASGPEVARDVYLARQAGLNLLRVRAHVGRHELYHSADESGVLLWQDMPLHGHYRGARRQAVRQALQAVDLLGHHPSVVVWCAHDEPFAHPGAGAGPFTAVLRRGLAHVLPTSNKSLLDRSVRRALERADPSRPAVAHSGVLPHPAWGSSSHFYYGWRRSDGDRLGRVARAWPAAVRFVSELGAGAVPFSAQFMAPAEWPHLDWAELASHHGFEQGPFDKRVPPARYRSFEAWRDASQAYQAQLVRSQVETLRRLRDRPVGGFAVFCLNDAQPEVGYSLVDHLRRPKAGFGALQAACAPVLVVSDWPAPVYSPGERLSLDVHVVNDLAEELAGAVVQARLEWPGGGRLWRFGGDAAPESCTFVGRLAVVLPERAALEGAPAGAVAGVAGGGPASDGPASWPVSLQLELAWGRPGQLSANRYEALLCARGR
ncbi:MAG: hypothetical protein ACRDZX_04230, partial [Acidimicrobiales bacterium]